MFLIELAFQGVRGLKPTVRLPLQAGLHVLRSKDAKLRDLVIDVVYHTLYPDPARSHATERLADDGASESRVALTYYGRDKATYRMIRNLRTGGVKLYRFDSKREKYKLLSSTAMEAAQFVRVQEGLPDDVIFERLFTFDPNILPGKGGRTRSGAPMVSEPPAPSAPGMPAAPFGGSAPSALGRSDSVPSSMRVQSALAASEFEEASDRAADSAPPSKAVSEDDKRRRYERLCEEYNRVARAELAQSESDQLASRRFELADDVEAVTRRRLEVERVRADMASFGDLSELPDGFAERLASYEERQARYESDQERHGQEMLRLEKELDDIWVEPLLKDKYFLIPVFCAGLALALAVLLKRPWVALLNIPAMLVAVGAALRWVGEREKHFRASVRSRAANDRQARLDKQHQLDTSVTRRMMERLGVDGPAAVLERVREFENRRSRLNRLEAEIAQQTADGRIREAERELKAIESRTRQLEGVVLDAAGATASAKRLFGRLKTLATELGEEPPVPLNVLDMSAGRQGTDSLEIQFVGGSDDLSRPAPASWQPGGGGPSADIFGSTDILRGSADVPRQSSADIVRGSTDIVRGSTDIVRGSTDIVRGSTDIPGQGSTDILSGRPEISGQPKLRKAPGRSSSVVGKPVAPPPGTNDLPVYATGDVGSSPPQPSSIPTSPPPPTLSNIPVSTVPPTPSRVPVPREVSDLAADLAGEFTQDTMAQSEFSSFVSAADPLGPSQDVEPPAADPGLFDFGGSFIGSDDDDDAEEGYGSGYGGSGSDGKPGSGGGKKASGYHAIGGGMGGTPPGARGYPSSGQRPDRSLDLFEAAKDLMTMEADELMKRVQPRMGQYLGALTSGLYEAARFGPRGQISVGKGDRFVAYPDLPPTEVDKVDVAVRLCLAEAALRRVRVPILIHDPCVELPDAARGLYRQMLGYLGRAAQVIVVTPHDDIEGVVLSLTDPT